MHPQVSGWALQPYQHQTLNPKLTLRLNPVSLASLESKYSSSQVSLGSNRLRDSAHMPTDSSPALKLLSSSSVLLK
jgi:hypothetical protein